MGIIIEKNGFSATFLPQVWKMLPDPEIFLTKLCLKAMLEPNDWEKKLNIKSYFVYAFSE